MKRALLALLGLLTVLQAVAREPNPIDPVRVMQLAPGQRIEGTVDIGRGVHLPYAFEISTKGNGAIEIGGLGIRSYDAHGDLMVFEGFLLRHQFVDVNEDGYRDLVLSGIVMTFGEKESDPVTRRAAVSVFLFDPRSSRLKPVVADEAIDFWEAEGEPGATDNPGHAHLNLRSLFQSARTQPGV